MSFMERISFSFVIIPGGYLQQCCMIYVAVNNCTYRQQPENGTHNLNELSPPGYGSVLQYACQDGYKLIGTAQQVCKANGTWSHDPANCIRKLI